VTSARPDVLIVGAGVSGLTTGVCLAESGKRVRLVADRRPRDSTSAAAGAIWDPIYATHPRVFDWSRRSYEVLSAMAGAGRPEVQLIDGVEASRVAIAAPEWARRLPAFRECTATELPAGFAGGWRYRAPLVDMPSYLRYLEQRLTAAGGEFVPGRLQTLDDGFDMADVVVNCSGVGARELVPDPDVEPVRGHLVAVRNPGLREFFAEHTEELSEMTYLLPQRDVLLLGGSAEKGEAEQVVDQVVAAGIIERCTAAFPEIAGAEVLGHRVGIRPQRPQVRLEHVDLGDRHLVHNYGHSGAGVSLSWGCAEDVAALVLPLLR
jgi:D-amino-acid oxidase